jgi:hypothetical protein
MRSSTRNCSRKRGRSWRSRSPAIKCCDKLAVGHFDDRSVASFEWDLKFSSSTEH